MADHCQCSWCRAIRVAGNDPLLRPPSDADRRLIADLGMTVDEDVTGGAA